jgi:deoxyadenosine/deoxycytidine kinase
MQSITFRLQSLEIAHERLFRHSPELPESFIPLSGQVKELLQRVFERWASLEPSDEFEQQRNALQHLSRDLEQQFDVLETGQDSNRINDQRLADLYTMTGSVRGLIDALLPATLGIT